MSTSTPLPRPVDDPAGNEVTQAIPRVVLPAPRVAWGHTPGPAWNGGPAGWQAPDPGPAGLPAFPPLPDPRPARSVGRGTFGVVVGAVTAGVLGLGVVAYLALSGGLPGSGVDVTGSLTVSDTSCVGMGWGYSDIHAGTDVTVRDASGTLVAVGELGSGESQGYSACVFPITIPDVPGGSSFYDVTISHRGTTTYTLDELRDGLWLELY